VLAFHSALKDRKMIFNNACVGAVGFDIAARGMVAALVAGVLFADAAAQIAFVRE